MQGHKSRALTLACLVLLLPLALLGCPGGDREPQARLSMDEEPPDNPADAKMRDASEPMPLPEERSYRADADDPREAAMAMDLDEPSPEAAAAPPAEGPMPIPEEPPAAGAKKKSG